jgi:hypothetical protein
MYVVQVYEGDGVIIVDVNRSFIVHNRDCKLEGKLHMLCVINRWPLVVENIRPL